MRLGVVSLGDAPRVRVVVHPSSGHSLLRTASHCEHSRAAARLTRALARVRLDRDTRILRFVCPSERHHWPGALPSAPLGALRRVMSVVSGLGLGIVLLLCDFAELDWLRVGWWPAGCLCLVLTRGIQTAGGYERVRQAAD